MVRMNEWLAAIEGVKTEWRNRESIVQGVFS